MTPLLRYLLIGGAATVAHWLVLAALVEFGGVPPWLGSGLGAIVGAQLAFLGNRHFTFGHRGALWPAWWRFMGTAGLGALVGMGLVAAGVALGMHYMLAQAVATAVNVLMTFAINRHWTFAR